VAVIDPRLPIPVEPDNKPIESDFRRLLRRLEELFRDIFQRLVKLETAPSGGGTGDMVLASAQTNTGAKTFLDNTLLLRNVANTFSSRFSNTNTAARIYTLKDASGTVAFTTDITGINSGTNTGDQTITLTGEAAGGGTGSFAVTLTNSAVIGKVLTGYASGAGVVVATDTILQAIQKINGNDALKAPIASPTFTGVVTLPAGTVVNGVTLTTAGGTTNFLRADGTYAAPPGGGGGPVYTQVEVDLGKPWKHSGKFTITGAGLTIGKPVELFQAAAVYTGKGTTIPDEASMDAVTATGVVTSAVLITCYWCSPTRVGGNRKFNYLVGS